MEKHLSLSELNSKIKNVLKTSLDQTYWVVAEISTISFNQSGHCYLELVEKDSNGDSIIARSKANIWAYALRMIKPYFETTTGQELSSGIKVLVNAGVDFHEMYGISLNIINIDPTYTVGDLERRKREIINKLTLEGVIYMNKELDMPLVPQKIAIISSETAAGYEDLIDQLETNPYGYKFYHRIFPAYMQGEQAEESIIKALEKVYEHEDIFDVVLIIRGGGSQADLNCFNSYWLSYNITQFPLPVITGIGHERDETIVDIVANLNFKTPTAVAEFLIDKLNYFDNSISDNFNEIIDYSEDLIQNNKMLYERYANKLLNQTRVKTNDEKTHLNIIENNISRTLQNYLLKQNYKLSNNSNNLKNSIKFSFSQSRQYFQRIQESIKKETDDLIAKNNYKLLLYKNIIASQNPKKILEKGYSLTYIDNKLVKDINKVKEGQNIKTVLSNGEFESTIKKI